MVHLTYLVKLYSVIQLLYSSLEGYIKWSITGVHGTVDLLGRVVLCDPVAVWFSRRINSTFCNRS